MPPLGADPLARAMGGPGALEAQARQELALVLDDTDESGLVSPVERTLVPGLRAIRALVDAAKARTCSSSARAVSARVTPRSGRSPTG